MSYKVIDNFLDKNEFKQISNLILDNEEGFEWFFSDGVTHVKAESEIWSTYFVHVFYISNVPNSRHFQFLNQIFASKLDKENPLRSWLRIKANLYPNTENIKEHTKHSDYDFSHKAAIFSLNTCDGFTRMSDGTKVDSVANRLILFDAHDEHNSSTTSDSKYRANINFNWL
jgi:hypothetical protein